MRKKGKIEYSPCFSCNYLPFCFDNLVKKIESWKEEVGLGKTEVEIVIIVNRCSKNPRKLKELLKEYYNKT